MKTLQNLVLNLILIILAILHFTKLPAKTRIMEICVCSTERFITTQHNLVLCQTKLSSTCKYLGLANSSAVNAP